MNTRWKIFSALVIPVAFAIGLSIAGCEREESESFPANAERGIPSNAIRIEITDSPANYSRMDLQINRVDVYHDVKGWIQLNSLVRSVNILSLANGVTTGLAVMDNAKTGHYSAVRIWFAEGNNVTLNTPTEIGGLQYDAGDVAPLTWGMAEEFVIVKIDGQVSEHRGMSILLDFNAEKSVSEFAGELTLAPYLTVMTNRLTGVSGNISGGIAPGFIRLQNGEHMYSAYSTPDGQFIVRGMMPGIYHLNIRVIKRAPDGTLVEKVYDRDDVKVTLGNITVLNDIPF